MTSPPGRGRAWWTSLFLAALASGGCHRSSRDASGLTINELMAGGASRPLRGPDGKLLVGADGQPADWVEIYNPLPTGVNLAEYTLSDKPDKPDKFHFPPVVLGPGEFLVVVADGNPEAGPLHADFKLSAKGEAVHLFAAGGSLLVDRKAYLNLEADATAGRYPDGGEDYGVIYAPTPGSPNKRIGIKPPRFQDAPLLSQDPLPDNPNLIPVTVAVLEDAGVEVSETSVERERAHDCNTPLAEENLLPGRFLGVVSGRARAADDLRTDVFGVVRAHSQEAITFFTAIPREADTTLLHLRTTAENEIGTAVEVSCHCFRCKAATVVINEFSPRNSQAIVFDRYSHQGQLLEEGASPDWIELYNYGDSPVSLADFALIGDGTYQDLTGPNPPPELYLWRFKDVGLDLIQPRGFLLVLADGDPPFDTGPDGKPLPAYHTYARGGDPDHRYRSTNFKISAGNKKHPEQGDSFHLLDPLGVEVDAALFNFSDQVGGEIAQDRTFGRLPDAAQAGTHLTHRAGAESGGRFLDCPTPEAPNLAECDVKPRFEPAVYLDPRCPAAGSAARAIGFLSIDHDTALADSPDHPQFEVELSYTAGSRTEVLRRGAGLEARPPTQIELGIYAPSPVLGTDLYLVEAEIAGQPAGTLVVFSLRARDLQIGARNPELAGWVELSETQDPRLSLRFQSGFAGLPLAINEVFPNADPGGPPLLYGPQRIPIPQMDYLEIYSGSSDPLDLSGMWLDDEKPPAQLGPKGHVRKFQLPPASVIAPHGFLCLFFPQGGQAGRVPAGAVAVEGLKLDDCASVIYLLSPDSTGNCIVAQARWDTTTGGEDPVCPVSIAVGMVPDGGQGSSAPLDLPALTGGPSPCASNCGGRKPRFSQEPLHFPLSSPSLPGDCIDPDGSVLIRAAVLIDSYAAVVLPAPVQGSPTGIETAELVVRKGDQETVTALDRSPLTNPPPPDGCWIQVRLTGQIRPPYPPVVFYRLRVKDGLGNLLESEELSFGVAGTKPPLAINEVMAVNTRTLADERGRFVPWIELWNGGTGPADFGGMFLTDDRFQPRKWQFPRTPAAIAPARGFLIVFADGDTADATDLHSNFTLKPAGPGDLFLLDKPENGTCLIDGFHYDFTGLPPDTSIGRLPDGTGGPVVLFGPTPGKGNSGGLFIRGDATGDGRVNVSDAAWLFQVLVEHAPAPSCLKALDVNDDGKTDLKDVIYLATFLFLNGPAVPPPFPDRGSDPTPDDLPCP
jgi:hypothetical protein